MRGCPAKSPKRTPEINPEIKDSMVAILFSVASPRRPPKATIGAKTAKYKNRNEEMH